jgi:uncharacterized protein YjbJ (UPF0337 family)
METTKAEGVLQEAEGMAEDTIGTATGNSATQLSGKTNELRGKAQKLCADTASVARDAMSNNPLGSLAVAIGAGFVLGALWSWNRKDMDSRANSRRDRR